MQKLMLLFSLILFSLTAYSQETITLSGGVLVTRAVDYSGYFDDNYHVDAPGFRITGTYEAGPLEPKKFIHGVSATYMLSTATINLYGEETELSIRTLPFCYTPKYLIGSENVMAFIRAAVGMQFTRLKLGNDESDGDFGFYGGIGVGGMAYVSKSVFFNLDYELAWMSNTFYANGYMNSVELGIGIDF